MGVGRSVDGMGGVHRLMAEGGGGVPDQRDVISELHAEAAGRFDAGVGDHADQDDMTNAVLLELQVEIGVGKPLDPQRSWATTSPGRGWKSSWNVPPQLSLAKICALAPASWYGEGLSKAT